MSRDIIKHRNHLAQLQPWDTFVVNSSDLRQPLIRHKDTLYLAHVLSMSSITHLYWDYDETVGPG